MDRRIETVALYLRVSTGQQACDSQEAELRRYCRLRGWEQIIEYRETAGGGAQSRRPVLDSLIQDARAGKVDAVVVYKLDRLGRSLAHLALILEEFDRLGVALVCSSQGIDLTASCAAAKLQRDVLMAVAEFERELIRERTKAGLAAARQKGVRLGRPPTLNRYRDRVAQLVAVGKSVSQVATTLKIPRSSAGKVCKAARVQAAEGG